MNRFSENTVPQHFAADEYRIRMIQLENGKREIATLYRAQGQESVAAVPLDFNAAFRLRVYYECLLPQVPDYSCGVAAAFTLAETIEHVMYFNTNYAHSDQELQHYDLAEFRKYRGRAGVVEGFIPNLQVRPGDYLLTVGIVPNQPGLHEFYELHFMQYPVHVRANGDQFPALHYPNVKFKHGPLDDEDARDAVTATMITAGSDAAAAVLPAGVVLDKEALAKIYRAMKRAANKNANE